LIINEIIWKQEFVDKLSFRHRVPIEEVEEVFGKSPVIRKVGRGHIKGENVYAAYSQIHNGRYMVVFSSIKMETEPCLFLRGTWISQKGDTMKDNEHKIREPLPETFSSEDEAGEFWDAHSSADYEEYLEPVDMTIDIKRRRFEIEVDRETFVALNAYAKKVNQPVKSLASSILKENIASL